MLTSTHSKALVLSILAAASHLPDPSRPTGAVAGAMASDPDPMDWKHDTPPQILFQSSDPFARSSHRRSLEEFSENRLLETGRSGIPSTSPHDSSAPHIKSPATQSVAFTNSYHDHQTIPTQANTSSFSPYHNTTSSESTHSYQQWLASRRSSYGEHGKAWRYVCQSIDTIGYGIAMILTSQTLRTYCFTGYKAGQYLFTKNRRVIQTYRVAAQTANGAKRRAVEIKRHYGPPTSPDRILLSPDQRRLLRFRQQVRDCSRRHDESHIYNPAEATRGAVANPLEYYMSGALQPIESPTQSIRVPGAWIDSPSYGIQAPCSLAYYNPDSPDNLHSSPVGATADDPTITNLQLTDPCVAHGTLNSTEGVNNVTNTATANVSDSKNTYPTGSAQTDIKGLNDELNCSSGCSVPVASDPTSVIHSSTPLSPTSAKCLNSAGEVDPTLLDIQRYRDRYRKQQGKSLVVRRYPRQAGRFLPYRRPIRRRRKPQRSSSTSILQPQLSSNYVDLPETPTSQASPIPPYLDHEVRDSPVWSYKGTPAHALSSPPILFTPPNAFKGKSSKKRVTFYSDPKTGQPVSRFRKYIPGTQIDDSFHSSPSDNGFSIHDEGSSSISDGSASGQLYSSPTMQEQAQIASSMQGVDPSCPSANASGFTTSADGSEEKEPAVSSPISESSVQVQTSVALGPAPESAPVTPDNNVLAARRKTTLSPSDQFVIEAPSPVTFDPPALSKPSVTALKQIANGRVRRPETITFAVTADGSPMRIPSASNPSSTAGTGMVQDNGCLLKENGTSLDSGASSKPRDPPSSHGQDDVSVQSSSHSPAIVINAAHVDSFSSTKASSNPESNGSSVMHEQDSSLLSDMSTPSFVVSSPATGALVPCDSSSSTGEDSNHVSAGSFQPKEEGSDLLSDQVDPSGQSIGTPAHGASSSPPNESNAPVPSNTSPQQLLSTQPPIQVAGPVDPATPDRVAKQLSTLKVSGRKQSLRSAAKVESDDRLRAQEEARIAAEKELKEKEEAEEKARKAELRKKSGARRMPLGPVIEPLTAEWEMKVTQALAEHMGKTVASSLVGVNITRRDIGKVLPQRGTGDDVSGWLNDEIVTAYLQIVVEHGLKASGHKRGETPTMHAFNTFFYKNLSEKGPQSILRWAKKAKIGDEALLNVERVFIPVHMHSNHWTLLVVSPKYRTIEYFDSLYGAGSKQIANAKAWLKQELKGHYKEEEWKTVGRAGPAQNNGADCGVFVSTTAKMIMLGVEPMAYSCRDIPVQRRRIVAELMNCGFGGELASKVVFAEDD